MSLALKYALFFLILSLSLFLLYEMNISVFAELWNEWCFLGKPLVQFIAFNWMHWMVREKKNNPTNK